MMILSALRGRAAPCLLAAGAILAAILTFGASQRRAGRQQAEADATARTLEAVEKAHEVDRRVDAADDAELKRLRRKWTR